MKTKVLKGRISFGRYSNCHDDKDREMSIRLEDDVSSTVVVEIRMSCEALMRAIMTSSPECTFTMMSTRVGMTREHKRVDVPLLPYPWTDEDAAAALVPFEVDGWIGHGNDLVNRHRWNENTKTASVLFERWIETEEGE